jgi:triosephosphate isomerase
MQKLAAGNWKMNGTRGSLSEIDALLAVPFSSCDVLLCLPATLIAEAAKLSEGRIAIGAQDCHANPKGAHTGDISASMLADAGASHVILGHSERRADHGETSAMVAAKARAAHQAGLIAVICLGETLEQRDMGQTLAVVGTQLAASLPAGTTAQNSVIAYEPVWAIGTGHTPNEAQIAEVHAFLRAELVTILGPQAQEMRLLYGGSVKPDNARAIFALANVDGALVGGASLKANDFGPIISALSAAIA